MLTQVDLTMDAVAPDRLAEFWRTAIGYVDEPAPSPFANRHEWLRSFGEQIAEGEPIGAAWLIDPRGVAPRLSILPVPESKSAKNRLHMDLRVSAEAPAEEKWTTVLTEVDRLVAIGASVLWTDAGHHVVLADPEGNEFCVA
jgi:hypothetical protein